MSEKPKPSGPTSEKWPRHHYDCVVDGGYHEDHEVCDCGLDALRGQAEMAAHTLHVVVQMPAAEGKEWAPNSTVPIDLKLLKAVSEGDKDAAEFVAQELRPHIEHLMQVYESGAQPEDDVCMGCGEAICVCGEQP